MTTAGLVFMLVSVGSVLSLLVWCLMRVLRGGRKPDPVAHD